MKRIEIAGLAGFTLSGILFVVSALRAGDPYALAGALVWTVSCVGWIVAVAAARPRE